MSFLRHNVLSRSVAGSRVRLAAVIGVSGLLAGSMALMGAAPAMAVAPASFTVTQSDIGTTVGDTSAPWTEANVHPSGRYEIVADADNGAVLDLETVGGPTGTATQSKLMHYFGSGAYPAVDQNATVTAPDPVPTIPLSSSFFGDPITMTYTAATYLSLQIEIYYGTTGHATLRQVAPAASSWSTFSADPASQWTTDTDLIASDGTTYLRNGAPATLTDILAHLQDQDPRAASIGVDLGSDSVGAGLSQLSSISFLGATFTFGLPTTPTPPAATDADLDQYIAANDIDVAATTDTFSVDGGAPGADLTALDPTQPIDASLPWTGNDGSVDVFGYSSPVFLGTFPVVNGKVVLTGLDLSLLGPGAHRLVFQGETTNTVSVVAITIRSAATGDPSLAFTGTDAIMPAIGGLGLLLLGLAVVVYRRERKHFTRP
jgi:hypothetical protein